MTTGDERSHDILVVSNRLPDLRSATTPGDASHRRHVGGLAALEPVLGARQGAQALRSRGHHGPLGLFAHVPFPSPDLVALLPWARYVTPLRDGMNLVAKEFVAAQDAENPGVLMLSRFAGAAAELHDAVITNPWHRDGMARDLDRALRMELDERRERQRRLFAVVSSTTATTWAEDFIEALTAGG